MKQDELDLRQALDYIDPRELSYSEWVGVGMGLKEAGYPVGLWEDWSRRDGRSIPVFPSRPNCLKY